MILKLQGNTVASAIALLSSGIIIGCARPGPPQATTPPPTSSQQTATQPVAQNTSSNDAVNQLLSTRNVQVATFKV
ncbi:hypothetical protein [Gloeocapsopsis dulcis]|uniref:Uncharacterized protein n=1 Tax=Gloeocapsopsis dulcis AAB1 = 1H9 TaxID=1433147 RepID=A0A6N8FTZ5_9CHRO|nr:hypothetical protein [Gloeocapsopsis dulcis]MUL36052.1 hypothetical protein [Gloeocapsopsis dulcis AAB1 = 1H9]WNN91479.1 hypothetical protein P0S91_10570 [Gloeocapsopsis dulcis]